MDSKCEISFSSVFFYDDDSTPSVQIIDCSPSVNFFPRFYGFNQCYLMNSVCERELRCESSAAADARISLSVASKMIELPSNYAGMLELRLL